MELKEEEAKTPVDGKDSPAGADDSDDEELDQNLLNAIISSGMPSPKKSVYFTFSNHFAFCRKCFKMRLHSNRNIASKPVPPKPVTQVPNARQSSQKVRMFPIFLSVSSTKILLLIK